MTVQTYLLTVQVWEEVSTVVSPGQSVTTKHLANLPYLKAFVKETFRLWPNGTEVCVREF